MTGIRARRPRLRLDPETYRELCREVLERDDWRCQPTHYSLGLALRVYSELTCTTYTTCTTMQNVAATGIDSSTPSRWSRAITICLILLILTTIRRYRNCTRLLELSRAPTRSIGRHECASICGFWQRFLCRNSRAILGSTGCGR